MTNHKKTSGQAPANAVMNGAQAQATPHPVRFVARDNSPISVAIAGLGKMGLLHAKAIAQLASGETEIYYKGNMAAHARRLCICAICDTDPQKQRLFPNLPFAADWRQLLDDTRPQLALIAAPTAAHVSMAELALQTGAHTLVEKPLTTSLRDYEHLRKTAAQAGVRLLAGHVERYNPVAIKLRDLLANGQLTPDSYRFQRTQPLPARISDDIITDKLIHDVDLALYFFGPIASVQTMDCQRRAGRIVEARVGLLHQNGMHGSLFVSWLVPDNSKRRQVELLTGNTIKVFGDFTEKTLAIDGRPLDCTVPGWISATNNQLKDQIVDFLGYCLAQTGNVPKPLLAPEEIGAAIAVVEKAQTELQGARS